MLALAALSLALLACSAHAAPMAPPIPPLAHLNVTAYLGRWYQVGGHTTPRAPTNSAHNAIAGAAQRLRPREV